MFNNKRSLLQRVRIAMVAMVTILGIGGAFAMNPPQDKAMQTWGVIVTNANSYVVTATTANSFCDSSSPRTCTVQSAVAPDPVTHELQKSDTSSPTIGEFNQ
jgi:hypothetical protein